MCRIYEKNGVPYVRACYRTGDRRGDHVPLHAADWNSSGTHLVRVSATHARPVRRSRCPRCGESMDECRERCAGNGAIGDAKREFVSRNHG